MILVRYDGLLGVESVDEEFDVLAAGLELIFITVSDGGQTGQIETGDRVEGQDQTCHHPTSHPL